jgi:hypothetical protein
MAFGSNSSDKQVVGGGLYTGLAPLKVTMICPTKADLEKRKINIKEEPEYLTKNDSGESKMMINFYMIKEDVKIYPKRAFWLEDKIRKNKDGSKTEWINKFGITAWSTDATTPPQYDWFKLDGARPALVGEGKLTRFIKAWANVDLEQQACLDNPSALAKGDLTELKALFAVIPNNEVQCLLGVNDKGYQEVWDGYFDRKLSVNFAQWRKELEKDGQEFKADYQGDFKFQPYRGGTSAPQDKPTNLDTPAGFEANPGGMPAF